MENSMEILVPHMNCDCKVDSMLLRNQLLTFKRENSVQLIVFISQTTELYSNESCTAIGSVSIVRRANFHSFTNDAITWR